jgi:anti-sigma factor RsiW
MNTKPADDLKPGDDLLALWLEGELEGPQRAQVDSWVAHHPELLAERAAIGAWKSDLRAIVAADEPPPFSDFFNSRIQQALVREIKPQPTKHARSWWRYLAVPGLAAAMVFCFWLGTEFRADPPATVKVVPLKEQPMVYTPLNGVTVEVVPAAEADGTVIVLEGLAAMPDSLEVPETSAAPGESGLKLVTKPEGATF